jgi:O-antigen/teichoic acid export membrane protein
VKRKFTTNLILLILLNIVVKPFWIFGIDRTVQNVVGPSEYGMFFALFNFSILLNIALDFGLTNFNNREISQHPHLLPRYLSNMVGLKFLMAIFYALLSFGLAIVLGYNERQLWLLLFLVFNQFLSSFVLYLRSNVSGLQMFRVDSFLSVTDRVIMIILCSVLLWTPLRKNFSIEWFVYTQTLSYLVSATIAFILVLKRADTFTLRFDRKFFITILKQSYPFAFLVLLMSFNFRVDSVMLERLLPDGHFQSGIYAQAFRLLDAVSMIPFLFATLLLPIFASMLRQGEDIKPLLRFALSLLIPVTFTFALWCFFYRVPIMSILYVSSSQESFTVFATLMLTFIFVSISYIFGTLLTANGSLRHLNLIALTGAALNFFLNLFLIPKYSAVGAAFASLVTQAFIATFQFYVTYRMFSLRIEVKTLFKFFAYGIVMVGLILLSQCFSRQLIGTVFVLIGGILLAFALKIIRIREILSTLFETKYN